MVAKGQVETEEEASVRMRCRDEAKIFGEEGTSSSSSSSLLSCGAVCGRGRYDGYALYPKRFSVNITSHIEWYLSRGVDIKVLIAMRDRTISIKSKLNQHCRDPTVAQREDELALKLMKEAMEKYSMHGTKRGTIASDDIWEERVIGVSYEGLMGMREDYLHALYHRLGIDSTYQPEFHDGNKKYVTKASSSGVLSSRHPPSNSGTNVDGSSRPPKPNKQQPPPPPKDSLLPKKVIAIFGPESSGTKFLSSTLGVATGSFPRDGQWVNLPPTKSSSKEEWVYHQYNYRRAMSSDGEWEVQHLSLPWGWHCHNDDVVAPDEDKRMHIAKAFVPEECFRYESDPNSLPEVAERRRDDAEKIARWRKKRNGKDRILRVARDEEEQQQQDGEMTGDHRDHHEHVVGEQQYLEHWTRRKKNDVSAGFGGLEKMMDVVE